MIDFANPRVQSLMLEVQEFLHYEADLLDERRFEDWLTLLAEDLRYRIPLRKNLAFSDHARDVTDENDIGWLDDDKATLEKRVRQILTGIHWAEEPLSRVSHLVTNIRVGNVDEVLAGAEEVHVSCKIFVHRNRLDDETDFFIGRRQDVLCRHGAGLKLKRRTVILDQSTLLAKNLTIFL